MNMYWGIQKMKAVLNACIEGNDLDITISDNPLIESLKEVTCRIDRLKAMAKRFYYDALLSRYSCPDCGKRLSIDSPEKWSCTCGLSIDPTTTFQKSRCCQAPLKRKTFHYACSSCGKPVASRFLFDEKIFDKAYFRERMVMSRRKKAEKRKEMRRLLAASRSGRFIMSDPLDLDQLPGLTDLLDQFVQEVGNDFPTALESVSEFSLDKYRNHIFSQLTWSPILFSGLAAIEKNRRRDRTRRFIALVFMWQAGEVKLEQDGTDIWIQKV